MTKLRTILLPQEAHVPKGDAKYLCVSSKETAKALSEPSRENRWFSNEMAVTGFTRHDALKRHKTRPKTVLIAPDWLRDISAVTGDNPLTAKPFSSADIAEYHAFWEAFFSNANLASIKKRHGLKLQIIAGRGLAKNPVLDTIVDQVIVHEPGDDPSVAILALAKAGLVITDQPSLAFDAAYLDQNCFLCRQSVEQGSTLPLPSQIEKSNGIKQLISHIEAHFHPRDTVTKTRKPKAFFPDYSVPACERVAKYLELLAEPKS